MRLVGRGHEAVRATHDKTLEFSVDPEIGERATCVASVGTVVEGEPLAGPVEITVTAGTESFRFTALANSAWVPGTSAVVRRSAARVPGTLATEASATAADLPRELVTALRDPRTRVEIVVEPIPSEPTAVLLALDPDAPPDPRLPAELAAARLVIAEDERAARLIGRPMTTGPVDVDGRVLVVATSDLPGTSVAHALRDVEVDVLGLPTTLAAAAAAPGREPLVIAPNADPLAALRRTPAHYRLVLTAKADDVDGLLAAAAEQRGTTGAVAVAPHARPVRVSPGSSFLARGRVAVCFDAADESTALDPTIRLAVQRLLDDGVGTRPAAAALATLTGWERRHAYDTLLGWRREPTSE